MSLLPVADALARLLTNVAPLQPESLKLSRADRRVLVSDLAAARTQPPFAASAMDGYAVRSSDAVAAGCRLTPIGTSRAGARFVGKLGRSQAIRIFTGAPVPEGADAILIQENAAVDGNQITVLEPVTPAQYIRPAGLDFREGEILLRGNTRLNPRTLSLAAAMGHAAISVRRRPTVVVLATGDELVPPGVAPGPDQIISSNSLGLVAFAEAEGAEARDLGIARDDIGEINRAIDRAYDKGEPDILVISGGASVGDHDLVRDALKQRGMTLDFWKIAMRPGKPMMVGRLGGTRVLGLPGNPVSSLVTAVLFLGPLIRALLGVPTALPLISAKLGTALPANDERQDYIRARLTKEGGSRIATAFQRQDSSMLATLAHADALIVRPPHAAAAETGEKVDVILLDPTR